MKGPKRSKTYPVGTSWYVQRIGPADSDGSRLAWLIGEPISGLGAMWVKNRPIAGVDSRDRVLSQLYYLRSQEANLGLPVASTFKLFCVRPKKTHEQKIREAVDKAVAERLNALKAWLFTGDAARLGIDTHSAQTVRDVLNMLPATAFFGK